MSDIQSDSDDGVYCEFKEYIKQAKKNLRKTRKKKNKEEPTEVEDGEEENQDTDEPGQSVLKKDDLNHEDRDHSENDDDETDDNYFLAADDDDKIKTESQDVDDTEQENDHDSEYVVDEEDEKTLIGDQDNDKNDSDNNATDKNAEQPSGDDDEEIDKGLDSNEDLTEDNLTVNYYLVRKFQTDSDLVNVDAENKAQDEESNDNENINYNEELRASDDDSEIANAFNVQYRYVFRYPKQVRKSQQPQEEMLDESNDAIVLETNQSEVIENYKCEDSEVCADDQSPIDLDAIEKLYDFIFKDPWEDLINILNSKRSSKSSTETDSVVIHSPQTITSNEEKAKEILESVEEVKDTDIDLRLNTRALSKEANTYELEKFDKNILIIFNQERIDGYKPRLGTRQDAEALTRTFNSFNFDIVEHLDLRRDEIFEELKHFSQMNFTDFGCIAIAVLTHGSDMDELRAKDRLYYLNDIINYLKTSDNPTLVTKPKILIIQACRGRETTHAVTVNKIGKITKDNDEVEHRVYTLPVEADFLIIYSTFPGKISHRDELNGTWFIQTLCEMINNLAPKEDLESIITEVKKEVAIEKSFEEFNRRTLEIDTNKQIPIIISTLIRKLYLKTSGEDQEFSDAKIDGSTSSYSASRGANCLCVFDRFEYLKRCMRYFLEDNEDDVTGRSFLDVAETLAEGYEFYAVKEQLSKAMSNHLLVMAKDCDFYKYLYFFKD